MFGEFVKQKRLDKRLSLRGFCRQLGEDASNWSKIERGKMLPPQSTHKLEKIAVLLGIARDTKEWEMLFDLASVDVGKIPTYIMTDKEVVHSLPLFFRIFEKQKPTKEDISKLIETVKKGGE